VNAYRKAALIVGVLYIIGTVTGVLGVVLTKPILDAEDYLVKVSVNQDQFITGVLLLLVMGLVLALVPVVVYPILKKHDQVLALGYVVFRGGLETFTYIASVIIMLLLVAVGQAYVQAGAPVSSSFQTLGALLLEAPDWVGEVTGIIFPLGALMFYYLLYKSKLIPRWISGWGLIAIPLYLASALLAMFAFVEPFSTTESLLRLPLGLQEMVMAVWLIVKGFDSAGV
jgi:hypothetical protein